MSTIARTSDSATTVPTFITGYEASYTGSNVVHDLIGGGIAVTLVTQRPRSGTLHLYYLVEAEAWDAVAFHLGTDTFTLSDPEVAGVGMLYAAGTITPVVRAQDAELWLVDVEYQELIP